MNILNQKGIMPRSAMRRSIDNFFNDRYRHLLDMSGEFTPALNARENNESYLLELAAPGLKKEDFKITVDNDSLIVHYDRIVDREDKDDNYISREFGFNSFSRRFMLPNDVDSDHISAEYEDGILRIWLPRIEVEEETEARKMVPVS